MRAYQNKEARYRKALENIKNYREHFAEFLAGKEFLITHEQRKEFIRETIEWAFSDDDCDPPVGRPNGMKLRHPDQSAISFISS